MFVLRTGWLTSKALARALGPWPFLLLAVWVSVVKLQEPGFFVRQGVPFSWASYEAALAVGFGILPLVWRIAHGADAALWTLQASRSATRATLSGWLGVLIYGLLLLAFACTLALVAELVFGRTLTLYRMFTPAALAALRLFASTGLFLVVIASLAPGLALLPWRMPTIVCVWLPILAGAIHLFGPSEFSEAPGAGTRSSVIVSGVLATLGGLSASLAQTLHRLRH